MNHHLLNIAHRWGRRCALIAAGATLGVVAYAQTPPPPPNTIEGVSGTMQSGAEVLRIDFAQPLSAPPAGFVVQSPARIALDFPGIGSKAPRGPVDINQGNLRSAQVAATADRARVVLNLKQPTTYRAEIQGNSLLITLDPATATRTGAQGGSASVFAEGPSVRGTQTLRAIDFRRGADNSGRILVDLPNNQVGVDIRQQGQNLVVELLKSQVPATLSKRLDVTDFGTPVQSVTTTQAGNKVRMVIAARGEWEHSAYQSGNQLVIEVHPVRVDPAKLTQGKGYKGEKLSFDFQNIEIRPLLQVIAEVSNFNIITSDAVTGNVTLRLKDVPWDQALDIILEAKGLGMKKSGNVIWIAPKAELDAKEKQDLEARAAVAGLEPLVTQTFQINYAKASDIATQLNAIGTGGSGARLVSARGTVVAEPRTNQLFISDIPSRLAQIQEIIVKLDVPVRQVMIEARVVEADENWGRTLGVRLGINGNATGVTTIGSADGTTYGARVANPAGNSLYNLPTGSGVAGGMANFAVSLFSSAASRFLTLEISALEADGRGKEVASPRVITADQTKAVIEQGVELPYQAAASNGGTNTQFRKASLKLEVTPQITPEGNVIVDLDVNKDSVGVATADGAAINTKHIKTNVLVENGGTVVIGGIFTMQERQTNAKVPLLGDIPLLGNLFRSRTRTMNKTEMLVFITPRIITDQHMMR